MTSSVPSDPERHTEWVYRFLEIFGRPLMRLISSPIVLHAEMGAREGGFLLAANHLSPYDVPCLMNSTRRRIDFLSIRELMDKPLVGWLFRSLNAMPLDRGRVDSRTLRKVVRRLESGRVVAMFPEGGIRKAESSVLGGGSYRSGIGRIAQLAGVPIVPVAILGTTNFRPWTAWLPLARTRYAVAFGEPIFPRDTVDEKQARLEMEHEMETEWRDSVVRLGKELRALIDS